ncbi:MAG: V-type ATPase subunit [Chloroflexota bacterium]
MYDYGNARIAAARSRLLGWDDLRRLLDARSPSAMLALLERLDDWRSIVAEVTTLAAPPAQAIGAAIERHRSRRLGALPGWYPSLIRELVEALVLPLDIERLIAIERRLRAGEPSDRIGAAVPPGALLDADAIGQLARAPSLGVLLDRASARGLLTRASARALTRLAAAGASSARLEQAIVEAADHARLARASGPGEAARTVREVVLAERAARTAAAAGSRDTGTAMAADEERDTTLARLDRLVRLGRRDPLGIGAVIGYVAAVEIGAIRLRAAVASVVAGWPADIVAEYIQVRPNRRSAAAPAD